MRVASFKYEIRRTVVAAICVTLLAACHWDMWNQDRYEPLEGGAFFGEGQSSSRELVAGTVPYKMPRLDRHLAEGKVGDGYADSLPASIDPSRLAADAAEREKLWRELLERGQERYNIYCVVCHGYTGDSTGMIVKRGFPAPPSYNIDRLREVEIGYFVDTMTNGFGRMFSYANRISPEDRWAIAAYIRALQLSQGATPDLLPADVLELAENPPVLEPAEGHGDDSAEH